MTGISRASSSSYTVLILYLTLLQLFRLTEWLWSRDLIREWLHVTSDTWRTTWPEHVTWTRPPHLPRDIVTVTSVNLSHCSLHVTCDIPDKRNSFSQHVTHHTWPHLTTCGSHVTLWPRCDTWLLWKVKGKMGAISKWIGQFYI